MNTNRSIQFLCLVIAVLVYGNASAIPWECGESESSSHATWVRNPDKGSSNNPLIIKVIFARFPDTPVNERLIDQNHLTTLGRIESLFARQSNGNHVVQLEPLHVPGQPESTMWSIDRSSESFGSLDNVEDFSAPNRPRFENYWDYPSAFLGELQATVLATIQDAFNSYFGEGNWVSPLAGADGIIFVYKPDDPYDTISNPLESGSGKSGVGGLALVRDVPELADIIGTNPPVAIEGNGNEVLHGVCLVWWNSDDLKVNTTTTSHEWGHAIGTTQEHTGSEGGYSIMRGFYPDNEGDYLEYPIFDHWSRVQIRVE